MPMGTANANIMRFQKEPKFFKKNTEIVFLNYKNWCYRSDKNNSCQMKPLNRLVLIAVEMIVVLSPVITETDLLFMKIC